MPDIALGPDHGHIIVCGLEHLGLRTIDQLRQRDETVVAIGPTDHAAEALAALDARLVVGDAVLPATLRQAGVETAASIVMTGGDDLENLNVALAAQELNPAIRVVIRMFDTELGGHIPQLFPDGVALSSSALAAPGFVSAAIDGETGGRFELAGRIISSRTSTAPPLGDRSVALARLLDDRTVEMLPDADPLDPDLIVVDIARPDDVAFDQPLPTADASARRSIGGSISAFRERIRAPEQRLLRFGTALVVLALGSALFFELTAGLTPLDAFSYAITLLTGASLPTEIDAATAPATLRIYAIFLSLIGAALVAIVYAFITDALIRSRLLQTLGRRTVPAGIHDHVIVAGLGAIGYRVALGVKARGVPVVVVETQDDGRFVAAARAAGIAVVVGDARHPEVLGEVHIERARALVGATSDDLVNLSTALNGRALRPDLRVVVRLFDPDFAIRVQRGFGIRFTRSVSQLAAPAFAAAATRTEVVATVPVGDRRVALFARLRVPQGSALEGRPAASLDDAGAVRLLAVADPGSEDARWDIPDDEVLDAGEEVIVATTRAGLAGLVALAATRPDAPAADHPTPWQIAQLNVGRAVAALDGPVMAEFMARLAEINALAERSPGFVWRLQGDGGNATDIKTGDDPLFIVNLSVWASIDDLHAFTYRSDHKDVFKRRFDWFERRSGPNMVMWWQEGGTVPDIDEALDRLRRLEADGPTPEAFTFRQRFPAPGRGEPTAAVPTAPTPTAPTPTVPSMG